ncbi:restriction endonuclease subunit S [Streptococcus himalayensis]|uniref:Type I restriction endonuclease MjaXP subunit S n=1 Tax=Streptococcus himalayensis TaxID=1888195 RepID=A0A917A7U9_9STRE|nr:restriction endonuclease subunit S [Streptococcus himalayensis]GGE31283.1 type I restriction endonuclease MjaXP subunit S [Streptococcus himalayensis]
MKLKKLKNIATIHNGATPSTSKPEYYGGELSWITPKDLSNSNNKYVKCGERNITELGAQQIGQYLPRGTVLLSSRAPIGLLAIAEKPLYTNQGFKNIVVNQEILNNEFLYYYLLASKENLQNLGSGTTFKEISKKNLESFSVPCPPLHTQQKIATLLSALDEKIALNNRINEELERMAKELYDYWFVQFDFPDENGKPYKSSGGEMVYNEALKREIPKGWEVKSLVNNNLCKIIKTGVNDFFQKYYLATADVNETTISNGEVIEFESRPSRANMQPILNSVWFAKMKDSIKHIFLTSEMSVFIENYIFSTGFVGLQCSAESFEYIASFIRFSGFESIKNDLSHGATQQAVNNTDLKEIELLVPDKRVLEEKYHYLAKPIFSKISLNMIENRNLAQLRDWLLPMLMNGQVKVE